MSLNRGMDKEGVVYTHARTHAHAHTHTHTHTHTEEYYSAIKRNKSAICRGVVGSRDRYTE